VLDTLFHALVRWMAPVLVFTTEEVWGTRCPDGRSVHLLEWPEIGDWRDEELNGRWALLRRARRLIFGDLEEMRARKEIGSSLEADVTYGLPAEVVEAAEGIDVAEMLIVASAELIPEKTRLTPSSMLFTVIALDRSANSKCGRCWRHLPEVAEDGGLCARCEQVIHG